jgi:hypothetical protein
MKKVFSLVMLIAALSGFAQEKRQMPEGGRGGKTEQVTPDEQVKQLTAELNLDKKQQEKVKALYAEQEKQRAAGKPEKGEKGEKGLKPEGDKPEKGAKGDQPNREGMEAKMKAENAEFDKKMKGILTDAQYKKWQESAKKGADGREKKTRNKKES